jgi:hypothetical protein
LLPARDWRQYTIRVLAGSDGVGYAGMGLMAGRGCFLTCAHVVNVALHGPSRISSPREPDSRARVRVQFPELGASRPAQVRSCRIVYWNPPAGSPADFTGDVAGLEPDDDAPPPEGTGFAPLLHYGTLPRPADSSGYAVEAFGYPAARSGGSFIHGRFSRVLGNGLLQLEALSERRPQTGYSGTPILYSSVAASESIDYVLGMLNYSSRDGSAADAYGVSAARLASLWPRLHPALVASTLTCRDMASVKGFQIGPDFTFDARRIIAERHTLLPDEEALALWTPHPVISSFAPVRESVVFTTRGIRVHPDTLFRAPDRKHIFAPYDRISDYGFKADTVFVVAGQSSHDKPVIAISGRGRTVCLAYSPRVLSVLREIQDVLTLSLY